MDPDVWHGIRAADVMSAETSLVLRRGVPSLYMETAMGWRILVLMLMSFGLVACGRSAPITYYLFESQWPVQTVDRLGGKNLGIARVTVPEYLDRNGIVTRIEGKSQLSIAQFHCWAEPLSGNIGRVLREEFTRVLMPKGIAVEDDEAQRTTWSFTMDVERLDGTMGGKVTFIAGWSLLKGGAVLSRGLVVDDAPVEGATYDDLVLAQSRLVHKTARHLADVIAAETSGEKR
ncbi:MAG: PqiC family protein [Desulfovibrio sp.]|nr:PqiC family protein [Desulfovibrio sp.]